LRAIYGEARLPGAAISPVSRHGQVDAHPDATSETEDESMRAILLRQFALSLFVLLFPGNNQPSVRVIQVHASRYAFQPSSITVRRGETIQLELVSDDVPHSLLVRALGINEAATKSHPGTAVFTATQSGDFHGRCGRFCGSGHGRMQFVVHVSGN
jgi:cytochrome c oxidase subunit 2